MQYARTADGELVHACDVEYSMKPTEEFLDSMEDGDGYYYDDEDGQFVIVPFADHPDCVLTRDGWLLRYGPDVPFAGTPFELDA